MASKDDGFARVHLQFLDMFIASGFKSLRKMEELRGTSEGGLVGLGEKAKLLLGAAVAETSLLSALYWITCAYTLLGHVIEPEMRQQILDFAGRCRCRSTPGAFAPHPAHQADLLNTVSAVQVAVLLDKPGILGDLSEVSHYVRSLQLPDGSFANRSGSNEGDCRFTFAALCALKLLARLENNDRKESLDTRCLKRSDVPSTVPRCFGVLEGAQKNSERSEDCGFDSAEDTIVSILFDR
ncbi:unnamed protein product [Durusdinium trenchii]|uniref:Geranylgeranyl transferase type II subunit beta n=1 Tax=Durusdinium trenchii TaxID=1381693 RepID=A0ABP0Q076_9DINO